MNVFLPFPRNIAKSIHTLDDRRLNKQILECKQIYLVAMQLKVDPNRKVGYAKHPVIQHYQHYLSFLITYAYVCCIEYEGRFSRRHAFHDFFYNMYTKIPEKERYISYQEKHYCPLYVAGSKPKQIYETEENRVGELFKEKLRNKWIMDQEKGYSPKWTNCNGGINL